MVTSVQSARADYAAWTHLTRMRLGQRVVEEYNLVADVDDSGRGIAVRISLSQTEENAPPTGGTANSVRPDGGFSRTIWLSRLLRWRANNA